MRFKIGVDVGGTFTDFLLMDEKGKADIFKVLSSPEDPSVAVMNGFSAMAAATGNDLPAFLGSVDLIVHGTTVTTNAVLTRAWTPTGLLTTAGFRDALEMRRGVREELYNNKYRPPEPVAPRDFRMAVGERVDHLGNEVDPLNTADVEAGVQFFKENGIGAVAICFMHSHANPRHELEAARRVSELMPDAYLSVSSKVLPQIRFYERTSTTVLNACVGPILKRYLSSLTEKLERHGFRGILLIMQSNGGVTTPAVVTELAASTLLSGPAAAPIAGVAYAAPHGYAGFITIDMGGTSFDTALIKDSVPVVTTTCKVNHQALALPMMDINTIGAGGGSIAWIDEGGLLKMGPRSAGARPGPACYGFGGAEPTCSDANLVLGYLNADYFAGGRIRLDKAAAEKAIEEKIARPLGLDVVEAAFGMFHIMNVNMASAIREISVRKGFDPREFPIICAGGAGPIHAAMIAEELEIGRIIIPRESSIFCAAGMLLSDLKHDLVRSRHTVIDKKKTDIARFKELASRLQEEGASILAGESIPKERRVFNFSLDLRYVGQYHEVTVDVSAEDVMNFNESAIKNALHAAHDRLYGYSLKDEGTAVELVNMRLTAIGVTEKPVFREEEPHGPDASAAIKGTRSVYLPSEEGFSAVDVYDGDLLHRGNRLTGPAVIEQVNTTTFVPAGRRLECDRYGNFLLTAG
jgi:N-methylhydantoinase A